MVVILNVILNVVHKLALTPRLLKIPHEWNGMECWVVGGLGMGLP